MLKIGSQQGKHAFLEPIIITTDLIQVSVASFLRCKITCDLEYLFFIESQVSHGFIQFQKSDDAVSRGRPTSIAGAPSRGCSMRIGRPISRD